MLGSTKGKRLNKYVADYVVFDLETTGISAATDEVIEISGIRVKNGSVEAEFTSLVNPGRKIPYGASAVNHITDDMVGDARKFPEVLSDFLEFAGENILVGHNIHSFDMKFIYRDCQNFYGGLPGNAYIDTLCLGRELLPQLSHHKLTDLAAHYGILQEGAHRALNDCRMNQKVFECLGRELLPQRRKQSGIRLCERCGSPMKKRNGKYGEFWGCSTFPQCRFTMPG
ncbi:MAG: exonuclease domain-containing protein [Muribaculaceae bacterium]|nr:exonuclease domain-containing protein [Roseburia sp.]MCM1431156.1 exonuclease domain-containing protein [Muribaculaceae bacterium]MCM1492579.1 exonuclease domain-containing protein [Muribaculaceae bacterium]